MDQPNPAIVGELAPQALPLEAANAGNLAGQDANIPMNVAAPPEPDAAGNGPVPLLGALNGLAAVGPPNTSEENLPTPLIRSLYGFESVAQPEPEE
ncbi:hypothetical protein FRC09_007235 [Ceratobasidium sp. 395]|nr:hypothetical protein FRC09_007235 [Ceratobasidium sp. 395]